MGFVKRFAFVPFLALFSLWLGWALTGNAPVAGTVVGIVIFVPLLIIWDDRRRTSYLARRSRH
jgi:hypothetical protein